MPDMLAGTFDPEEPLSFEHWVNSFATVTALYGVYRTAVPKVQERLPDLQMPHVVDDGVDDAVRANDDLIDDAAQASASKGTLTGSLNNLTADERQVVEELSELKTLHGTSSNTPVTRITDGFKQNADVVILDARKIGMTAEQAYSTLARVEGVYGGDVPGSIEIWTVDGVIYGGK